MAQGSAPPRETRLALVMNGGVSLAVWMGGVSAEIDRLRRAGREPASDDGVLALWEQLVNALNVRVTVDVVAGTSAGGLNGAALATSIARGTKLPDLRKTWLEVASIKRLAEDENQKKGDRPSVLNGEMFAVQICKVFGCIEGPKDAPPKVEGLTDESVEELAAALSDEAAAPRAVTLYTTATSLRGKAQKYGDATGEEFDQLEYRIVCQFRRDLQGTDEFAGDTATDQLSRAARASASFPAAFQPAFFRSGGTAGSNGPGGEGPDMAPVSNMGDESRWVIDGGVLDNEPFGPVLDEIARRPIDADVDRVVAYVVPEGGLMDPPVDTFATKQGIIAPTMAALSLPREVNLANQLDRLRQMERDVRATRDDDGDLYERARDRKLDRAVEELIGQYRASRVVAAVWEARKISGEIRDTTVQVLSAPDAVREPDKEVERYWLPTYERDIGLGDRWRWGPSAAERVLRLAMSLQRTAARKPQANPEKTSRALVALSAAVWQLQGQRRSAHEVLKDEIGNGVAALRDDDVLKLLDAFYASAKGRQIEAAILATLRFALAHLPEVDPATFAEAALKVEVVRRATAGTEPYAPKPRFRFYRFGANGGSPLVDGGKPLPDKLLGLRVGHFGGFLDTSWRAYDWTWGRMDGAAQLIGMLVNARALEARFGDGATADLGDADANEALADLRVKWDNVDALTRLQQVLVAKFHRAILSEELPTMVRTMGAAAPPQSGDEVTRFKEIVKVIPQVSVEQLRKSEGGHKTTERLVADGLNALSGDPNLPLKPRLPRALRTAAKVELGIGTALGWLRRGG